MTTSESPISGFPPPDLETETQRASGPPATAMETESRFAEPPKLTRISLGTICSIASMLLAAAALVFASLKQQKVQALRLQLNRVQASAQAALAAVNSLRIPKDLSPDLASLEATVNKLRAANDGRQQSLNGISEEIKKIPALDNRLTEQVSGLAAKQAEFERETKSFRANEQRMSTIIAVLKNQDTVLRQLAERTPESSKEP